MAAAYGLAGFGYIVNATFLPTLLRTQPGVADAALTGWLVVGLAAAGNGVVDSSRIMDRRLSGLDRMHFA